MKLRIWKILIPYLLLIVPIWNWNLNWPILPDWPKTAFNRTNMELKFISCWFLPFIISALLIVPIWNWNTTYVFYGAYCKIAFNRTNMELKCQLFVNRTQKIRLLIVPIWNWNGIVFPQGLAVFKLLIVPIWNWN